MSLGPVDAIAAKDLEKKKAALEKASGGKVELTAVAARRVVDSVIRNTGVIEANTIGTHNGMIVLGAETRARKPAGASRASGRPNAATAAPQRLFR